MASSTHQPERRRGERLGGSRLSPSLSTRTANRLAADLGLLADPVRLQLVDLLMRSDGPACVCDLEAAVPVKQPTVSHHLKLLRRAGLVSSERRGVWSYYSVDAAAVGALRGRIAAELDRLARADLRPADSADLPAVRRLLEDAGLPVEGVDAQFGEQYAVATWAGRVVGVAGIETYGLFGLLRSVAVAKDQRGRGLGEALILDRLAWARSARLTALYLLTTTAMGYFPRFGFIAAPRGEVPGELLASSEFASICPASATMMRWVPGAEAQRA